MYEQAFQLTSRPFTSMHYVKHYFPAKAISEALKTSQLAIERGAGPVVVIGDHGTGKTLMLAMLEEGFKDQLRIVNLSADTIRGREDLLQNILYQLQLNHRGLGENEMRLDVVDYLKKGQAGGILLLIDNAQKMTPDAFEEIQPLLDFVHDGQPQIRLVLAGSQGVEDRLADNRLVTFNQRIAGRCFLSCLGSVETEAYVRAHLVRAGGDPDALFAPESWRAIYEVTEGRPRFINQLCDHAMIFSATRGVIPVTDSLVREAWFDIQRLPGSVAPAGSGASISTSPIVTQRVEAAAEEGEEGEGWTVLEFGELSGDAEATEVTAADVAVAETPAVETEDSSATPEPEQESPVARDNAAIIASAVAGLGLATVASNAVAGEAPAAEPPAENVTSPAIEIPPPAAPPASDPFNTYDFEHEEVLTDAYSPFVAQQNQRSLEVTSEHLQNLTPTDEPQSDEVAAVTNADVQGEAFPTFTTAMQSQTEPAREAPQFETEVREEQPTRVDNNIVGVESLSQEFDVVQQPEVNTTPVEALPGSGYVPLDPGSAMAPPQVPQPVADQSGIGFADVAPAAAIVGAASQVPFVQPPAQPQAQVPPAASFQEEDPEIRRQAEEIIRSLRAGENQPGQGEFPPIQQETNAIESSIDQTLAANAAIPAPPTAPIVMPNLQPADPVAQQPTVPPAQPVPQYTAPPVQPVSPIPVQMGTDPVEPERRILEDIREQVASASDTISPPAPAAVPIEQVPVPVQQDDRDILNVNQQPLPPIAQPAAPEEMPAWTQEEPSSGEASRVDYQKLFDQLRSHQSQQEDA